MVQKYQSPVRVYKYPFELVMKAYERRFPSCPQIPVVMNCEVISEEQSPDLAVTTTERRCKLHVDAPYILKKIIGVDHVYFIQKNVLNLRTRTLDIEAYNESFQSRVVVLETCRYFVHPENGEWTCFEQCAEVDIKSFFGFEHTIEKLAMKQYAANIAKGKEIIEHFMAELRKEGVTRVEPWVPPPNSPPALPSPPRLSVTLDTDYIQRYLGQLSPIQESSLVQLRNSMAALQKGKVPGDTTLLRFLRAREFNVEKARCLLAESLNWRKKHGVDRVLSEYVSPRVVADYFPGAWHHHDKDGRPVYLLRLGQMDVKGLLKSIGEDGLLKLTMHVCEEGLRLTEEATLSSGKPVSTWCLLVDLEGLNMRHLWRPGIKALLRIIEIVESNYPETLGRVLIIRAPRAFPILWTLVSTFIDETTRTKFLLYGGNDYQEPGGLVDYIPQHFVPDFLGGPAKTKVCGGGVVPKDLYLTEAEQGSHLTDETIYQSVTIPRGHSHEVVVEVEEGGSLLTWDFDVLREEVEFKVYYKGGGEGEGEGGEGEGGSREGGGGAAARVCDGESVQGSEVAPSPGLYALHWTNTGLEHKAHIMYYYQLVSSSHYTGSMSSLQSSHSSFSALSHSCPSR